MTRAARNDILASAVCGYRDIFGCDVQSRRRFKNIGLVGETCNQKPHDHQKHRHIKLVTVDVIPGLEQKPDRQDRGEKTVNQKQAGPNHQWCPEGGSFNCRHHDRCEVKTAQIDTPVKNDQCDHGKRQKSKVKTVDHYSDHNRRPEDYQVDDIHERRQIIDDKS